MSSTSLSASAQPGSAAAPRVQTRPRLSIVLLSAGSIDLLDRALDVILATAFYLETELVVVRVCRSEDERTRLQRMSRQFGFLLELAPAHSARDVLADLGANRASGDIVTLKEDRVAFDGLWLSPYMAPAETVIWAESMSAADVDVTDRAAGRSAAGRTPLADRPVQTARPLGAPTLLGDVTVEHVT